MPYPTVFATTMPMVIPWDVNPFHFDLIWRRIAFSRLRAMESKYREWEFWPKEALSWWFERWEYLLLEQITSSEKRGKLLIGCVLQRKRLGQPLLFEELTGETLNDGDIHISRLAGSGLEKLHLFRFFLALYDYATEKKATHVYAVIRSGLLFEVHRMFREAPVLIEIVPGEHFHRGGYEFIPVKMHVYRFESFARIRRDPFGSPRERFRKGNSSGLKKILGSPPPEKKS